MKCCFLCVHNSIIYWFIVCFQFLKVTTLPLEGERGGGLLGLLLRLNTIHRILRGSPPALDTDGGEGDGRDSGEGEGKEPPVDGCALGEALQPLLAEVPGDGGGEEETEEEQDGIMAGKEQEDGFLGGAEDLADADLLAAVLSLEEREAKDTDEGDDEADDREE